MTVVIVGADRVGTRLAKTLIAENMNVIMFEQDMEKANMASNSLDCLVINKDGLDPDNLRDAGVSKADYFISLTGSDERNMIACGLVNREFNTPNKIASVHNITFTHTSLLEKSFLGIDYIVNPELEAAKEIISKIEHGATGDIMLFENTSLQIRTVPVPEDSVFAGKLVKDLHTVLAARVLVALIYQDGQYTIPKGDTLIQEGDLLYLMGNEEDLSKVLAQVGKERINLNKMIIVGGNDISAYVCQHFYDKGEISTHKKHFWNLFQKPLGKKNIAIIDRDYKRCKELAARFPEALILNEDISDDNVLEDEGLTDGDLIMAATENQELNIVSAVYAKSLGVKKALALVKKTSYLNVATNLGIDVPISLNYSTLQGILRFMRRRNLKNSYAIPESDIEVIQLQVPETSMAAGLLVKEMTFPPQSLILSVKSGDQDILPNGNYEIKKGDNIIMMVKKDNIDRVQKIFE